MMDHSNANDNLAAGVGKNAGVGDSATIKGRYIAECHDANGNLKWRDTIENLITDVGANDMLDKHLAGSTYTAAWYMGLIGSASYTSGPAAGDTMASHGGWVEAQNYSQASRPTCAFASASARSKALSSALQFSINASITAKGAFVASNATKGGTTGILFSAGTFSGGDKALSNGDTLSISYSCGLT
jgi:hypothetical protein